jgi:hypothetical protein
VAEQVDRGQCRQARLQAVASPRRAAAVRWRRTQGARLGMRGRASASMPGPCGGRVPGLAATAGAAHAP